MKARGSVSSLHRIEDIIYFKVNTDNNVAETVSVTFKNYMAYIKELRARVREGLICLQS
jgi:hypothetical protein